MSSNATKVIIPSLGLALILTGLAAEKSPAVMASAATPQAKTERDLSPKPNVSIQPRVKPTQPEHKEEARESNTRVD